MVSLLPPSPHRGPHARRRGGARDGPRHRNRRRRRPEELGRPPDPCRHAGGRPRHVSGDVPRERTPDAVASSRPRSQPTAKLQAPPPAPPIPPPTEPAIEIDSSIGDRRSRGRQVAWEIDVPSQSVAQVDFAVDGTGLGSATTAPFLFNGATGLDTTTLPDGVHTLAVKATFARRRRRDRRLAVHRRERSGRSPDRADRSDRWCPSSSSQSPLHRHRRLPPTPAASAGSRATPLSRRPTHPGRDDQAARRRARRLPRPRRRGPRDPVEAARRRPEPAREHRHRGGRAPARPTPQPSRLAGQPRASAEPGSDARRSRLVVRADARDRQRRGRRGTAGRPTR